MRSVAKPGPRILHVVRQFPPSVGGLEAYVSQLAEKQAASARVSVLTLDRLFGSSAKLKKVQRVNRTVVIRVPYVGFSRFFVPFVSPKFFYRYDLVHLHALDQLTDLISFYRAFGIPPLIVTSHGLFFHTQTLNRTKDLYFRTISKLTLSRVAKIFAVSRIDHEKLERIGVRSEVLSNPVQPFPWLFHGGKHLIYWGRIAENKSVERLIPFFAHISQADRSRKLFIVGSGAPRDLQRLGELISSSGLRDSVELCGYLDRASLEAVLGDCGYSVSASRYEGYGMVQVEGMSAGLLPIMQRNPAFEELFDRSGVGLLLDFSDPKGAASRFLEWERRLAGNDRQNARAFAMACAWPQAAAKIEATYQDVLASEA